MGFAREGLYCENYQLISMVEKKKILKELEEISKDSTRFYFHDRVFARALIFLIKKKKG